MNRFSRSEPRFTSDHAVTVLIDALPVLSERYRLRVHGYAVMPNHYHLMLETPEGNLAEAMQFFGSTVAGRLNRLYGCEGPVFRGRYQNKVVECDRYWLHLLSYLHNNPVAARLARRAEDCLWTSHRAYLGLEAVPDWLEVDELLELHGGRGALARYVRGVRLGAVVAPDGFAVDYGPTVSSRTTRPVPPPRTLEQAIEEVCEVTRHPVEGLRPTPGKVNTAYWLLVWWALRSTPASTRTLASWIGVTPSRVAQVRRRAASAEFQNLQLQQWMSALRDRGQGAPAPRDQARGGRRALRTGPPALRPR
jgi:REP element-mobilizing transposase RayT